MITSRSLVLKPVADEDALFEQLDKFVHPWFKRFDLFLLHQRTLEDEEAGITTAIWRDPARPEFELRLVADDEAPMLYITVVPDERADADALLKQLAKGFDAYRPAELLPDVVSNPRNVAAWTRLAIALNGRHDQRAEKLLLINLSGSDAEGLEAAATAAALLRWPSLAASLRAALARRLPGGVRPALKRALKVCAAPEAGGRED